jgi:hypothetical protein
MADSSQRELADLEVEIGRTCCTCTLPVES